MTNLLIPVTDYSGETSTASFPVLTAILDANITALFNAVDGVVLGNLGQSKLFTSVNKDNGGGGNSSDPYATRQLKYLCRYHDNTTGEKYTLEIPAPDMSLLGSGTDFVDLSAGAGLTFKTDFDTYVKARRTGNAVTLDSVELRGRKMSMKKP